MSKIHIHLGEVDVEFEGSEEFIKDALLDVLKEIANLIPSKAKSNSSQSTSTDPLNAATTSNISFDGSINTIAAKLKAESGPDLILAATAHHVLVQEKPTISRKELIAGMRSATAYFKPSYISNLSAHLKALIKTGTLTETSANTYSLSAKLREQLASQLK